MMMAHTRLMYRPDNPGPYGISQHGDVPLMSSAGKDYISLRPYLGVPGSSLTRDDNWEGTYSQRVGK